MLTNLKNNKGWAMPTVIIVVTVLVIICAALLNNTVQSYHYVGSQDNIGNTYLAGEAALDRWFNVLSAKAENNNFHESYPGDADMEEASNIEAFANYVINEIRQYLNTNGFLSQAIDIEGVSNEEVTNEATVVINDINNDIKLIGYRVDGDKIIITIGIQATAKYSKLSSRFKAFDKQVYGQMEFVFKLPEDPKFKLLGPVYSFGDLFVSGYVNETTFLDTNAYIRGDTYVFGSYPEDIAQPQQWYYGGIFASNRANITIDGNAYVRSFIRTGKFLQNQDNSWIRITKDAICQSIQLFGDGDRALVYRNAYTFDDLEVNGEDAVIGINGSFIGLSRGRDLHDESSAIVNSAPIHNLYSPASFLSRIFINGDVLNRGGTFKIDEEGKTVGQIEDASIAWDNRGDFGGNAYYKTYVGDWTDYHNTLINDYMDNLGKVGGFLNLFQIWNVQGESNVENWFIGALGVRQEKRNVLLGREVPSKISGYWDYEIVGNDKVYRNNFIDNAGGDDEDYYTKLDMISIKNLYSNEDKFVLDNIYTTDNSTGKLKLRYGNNTWENLVRFNDFRDGGLPVYEDELNLLIEGIDDSGDKIPGVNCIKDDLLKLTHFFATRDYPEGVNKRAGSPWIVSVNSTFRETLNDLETLVGVHSSNEETKYYILDVASLPVSYNANEIYDINYLYNIYHESISEGPGSLYDKRYENEDDNKYYLIVNSNPNVNLAVSGTFNGIIFTAGKVYLRNGADIWGSVIAAGYTKSNGDPDLNYIKVVNQADVDILNNGGKASIIVEPGARVKIDFYLGNDDNSDIAVGERVDNLNGTDLDFLSRAARKRLLGKFERQGLNLSDIF